MSRRQQDHSGFSVIELVVVISLLTLVLGMAGNFIVSAINAQTVSLTRDQLSRQTRFSLDELLHDLREANSGDPTIDPVVSFSATALTFYSPDRQTPYHMQKISYQLSGTNLQRSITTSTNTAVPWTFPTTAAWTTVIPNVQSMAFSYKDASGATTSFSSKVQRVDITITIDNDPTRSPWVQTYNLSTDLRITNA